MRSVNLNELNEQRLLFLKLLGIAHSNGRCMEYTVRFRVDDKGKVAIDREHAVVEPQETT